MTPSSSPASSSLVHTVLCPVNDFQEPDILHNVLKLLETPILFFLSSNKSRQAKSDHKDSIFAEAEIETQVGYMTWPMSHIWEDTGLDVKPGQDWWWSPKGWGMGMFWDRGRQFLIIIWPSILHNRLHLSWRQGCWGTLMDPSPTPSLLCHLPSTCPDSVAVW